MEQKINDTWNDYFIEATDVLKNNFNITDNKKLEEKETHIVFGKLAELQLNPIKGAFDSEHLKRIHKYLFEDIYPFAGKYRTCTLAKTTRNFYDPDMIPDELNKSLQYLLNETNDIMDIKSMLTYWQKVIII